MASDPPLADSDVAWGNGGKNMVPPLHFVCDAVFHGLADQDEALAMAEILIGSQPS